MKRTVSRGEFARLYCREDHNGSVYRLEVAGWDVLGQDDPDTDGSIQSFEDDLVQLIKELNTALKDLRGEDVW